MEQNELFKLKEQMKVNNEQEAAFQVFVRIRPLIAKEQPLPELEERKLQSTIQVQNNLVTFNSNLDCYS